MFTKGDIFEAPVQTITNAVKLSWRYGSGSGFGVQNAATLKCSRITSGVVRTERLFLVNPTFGGVLKTMFLIFQLRTTGKSHLKLEPIREGLEYLLVHYQEWQITSLAVPALGCGRGGLSWGDVQPLLVECFRKFSIPIRNLRPL